MRQLFRLHIFLVSIALTTSCTSTLYVSTLQPSRKPVPSNIQQVLIGVKKGLTLKHEDSLGVERIFYHLKGNLSLSPRFEVINPDNVYPICDDQFLCDDTIPYKELLDMTEADALLMISDVYTQSDSYTNEYYETYEDEYGQLTTSKVYTYSTLVTMKAGFKMYSKNSTEPVSTHRSSHFQQLEGYERPTPEEEKSAIDIVAYKLVEDYHSLICPQWKRISREYYSTGHNDLITAKAYIDREEVDKAIIIWRNLTKSDKKSLRSKACFNMAVASELKGNFDLAFDWLGKAERLGCPKASEYEKKLRAQQEIAEQLDKEFGN